jgi:hypothetical protein
MTTVERLTPTEDLIKWKQKINPSVEEWHIVERAAQAIDDLMIFKESKGGYYKGMSAWDIIEEHTGPENFKTFHRLCTLTTLLYAVRMDDRVRALKSESLKYKPEVIDKIRSFRREGVAIASIAARLRISNQAVYRIISALSGIPHYRVRKRVKKHGAKETE